jgi:hypothetical protein
MSKTLKTPLREFEPFPGLFYYSGFGWGTLYLPDEEEEWLSRTEAIKRCKELDLPYKCIDSIEGYNPSYLGD